MYKTYTNEEMQEKMNQENRKNLAPYLRGIQQKTQDKINEINKTNKIDEQHHVDTKKDVKKTLFEFLLNNNIDFNKDSKYITIDISKLV